MKNLLLGLLFIFYANAFSQNKFKPGYFILNNGEKKEVQIKFMDWKNNPDTFEFRSSENQPISKIGIDQVKYFEISNQAIFSRARVPIEQSSNNLNSLSTNYAPEYIEKEVFLEVLVAGEVTLYKYEKNNKSLYFIKPTEGQIEPLVFKKYRNDQNDTNTNRYFQQQLFNHLKCEGFERSQFEDINYTARDLSNLIVEYNQCKGNLDWDYRNNSNKAILFQLRLRPGLNYSSFRARTEEVSIDFNSKTNIRVGIEAEFVFPFNNNKWSALIEPTYQVYSDSGVYQDQAAEFNYSSIELPLGIRHYLYINDVSKFFINLGLLFDFAIGNSALDLENQITLDIKTNTFTNITAGMGFEFHKWSLESRFQTKRDPLGQYTRWNSSYQTISLILGYQLF